VLFYPRQLYESGSVTTLTAAERVNVVLGIYKHYPGSISSLKQYPRVYFTKPKIDRETVDAKMPPKT
jgi:hypothetical protein